MSGVYFIYIPIIFMIGESPGVYLNYIPIIFTIGECLVCN